MDNKKNKITYITKSTVINMGFTDAMTRKLLPAPVEKPNPHYRYAAPMKLYDKAVVEQVMTTEAYKTELERSQKRKKAAKKAVETRKTNLVNNMTEIAKSIKVKVLPEDELTRRTLEDQEERIKYKLYRELSYLERHSCDSREAFEEYLEKEEEYENFEFYPPSEKETLDRWIVNYIRHDLVDYDEVLYSKKGQTGLDEAYVPFKKAILDRIAEAYPMYAAECENQKSGVTSYRMW